MYFLKSLLLLVFVSSSFAQEGAFNQTDFTEEELNTADNYIHEGLAQREYLEACNQEDREANGERFVDLCVQDRYAFGGDWQFLEALVPQVTELYSATLGMTGGKMDVTNKKTGETSEKSDFCKWIPMVGEATNIAYTQIQQTKTQQNFDTSEPQSRQKAAFEALAKTHKDAKTASWMQVGVYGASGACYGAMLFPPNIPTNQGEIIAKVGASALIATFYGLKAKAHEKRAELLEALAEKMPGVGDCNPITDNLCFCNEESSFATDPANYQKYCMPEELVSNNSNNDAYVCADKNGNADPTCACDASNSCIDHVIKGGALDFGIAPTMMKDPLAALRPLNKGFGTGSISAANKRNRALADHVMKKYKPDRPINLNSAEKKLAGQIHKLGIPKAVAATMAKQASRNNKGSAPASIANFDPSAMEKKYAATATKRAMKPKFEKGKSAGKSARSSSNPFGKFKNRGGKGGVEIDGGYAEKARLAAEIHNNPGASIFQVISNRYQLSGWKQFPDAFEEKGESQ